MIALVMFVGRLDGIRLLKNELAKLKPRLRCIPWNHGDPMKLSEPVNPKPPLGILNLGIFRVAWSCAIVGGRLAKTYPRDCRLKADPEFALLRVQLIKVSAAASRG